MDFHFHPKPNILYKTNILLDYADPRQEGKLYSWILFLHALLQGLL